MYLDSYLSWKYHIHELSKKLSRANGILSKLRYNAPFDICLQVYYSIFYSHLIYGCNIWGLATEENIDKIEVLQKKCIRILTFSPFNSHTGDLFKKLKILKVRDVIKMHQLKVAFDFLNNRLPSDLMSLFELASDVHPNHVLNILNLLKIIIYISLESTLRPMVASLSDIFVQSYGTNFSKKVLSK